MPEGLDGGKIVEQWKTKGVRSSAAEICLDPRTPFFSGVTGSDLVAFFQPWKWSRLFGVCLNSSRSLVLVPDLHKHLPVGESDGVQTALNEILSTENILVDLGASR
jgi:hypothetical protein